MLQSVLKSAVLRTVLKQVKLTVFHYAAEGRSAIYKTVEVTEKYLGK